MSTELTIKKGRGVPKDADMAEAELALDLDDGTLYSKLGDGLVHALNEVPDADNYGHWKLQVDYGQPYEVESGRTANFEGTNGIKVTRTGDTVTIDGSELDLDEEADNYQYWTYRINGFNTTNVLSTQLLDFQSGDGIDIAREGYGIKISATGGGGGGEFVHIGDTPPDSPEEGQQWMEVPASGEATMWIYDGAKWLQHPSGKDGAPGADGNIADATTEGVIATWNSTDGRWTPDNTVVVSGGNVGIGKAPGRKLDVESAQGIVAKFSSTNASFPATISLQSPTTTLDAVRIGADSDNFVVQTSGNDALTIDSSGDATFSGTVSANTRFGRNWVRPNTDTGLAFGTNSVIPLDSSLNNKPDTIDIGHPTNRFKDGFFSGTVSANTVSTTGNISIQSPGGYYVQINPEDGGDSPHIRFRGGAGIWYNVGKSATNNKFEIHGGNNFDSPSHTDLMSLDASGNVTFGGTVNGVRRLVGAKDLIETLHTLREATKDETTIKGLRDAIGNAVGGLIEKFEAMQAVTQEISDE